jgi:predicted Zn-dependent protease
MKNIITNNKALFITAMAFIVIVVLSSPIATKAYIYYGYKWPSYPVSVDVSDSSFPSSWTTALANAMSAWNAASSPFYFNIGSSGHQVKCANNGNDGYPAITHTYPPSGQFTDIDTVFNTYYPWSTSGGANALDVQNIATHELGHWLVLWDLTGDSNKEKTMYYQTDYGETKKRTLETDDLNGINYIYP